MKTSTIVSQMKERGILIGKISHAADEPENIIFIAPPLILTLDEADQIVETLKDILTSIDC
jgi:4-aminobutyrate aminotransferase-like enzyme